MHLSSFIIKSRLSLCIYPVLSLRRGSVFVHLSSFIIRTRLRLCICPVLSLRRGSACASCQFYHKDEPQFVHLSSFIIKTRLAQFVLV